MEPTNMEVLSHASEARPFRLYTVGSVVWASVVGAPLGGGIVLAMNYRRLGEPGKATQALLASAVATIALFGLVVVLRGRQIPNASLTVPPIFAMYYLAKYLQGPAIDSHRTSGGPVYSKWRGLGIGVITGVVVLVVAIVTTLLTGIAEPEA